MLGKVHFCCNIKEGFPVPRFLSLNPVAIDVSSNTIRIVKMRKHFGIYSPEILKEVSFGENFDILNISKNRDSKSEEAKKLVSILSDLKKELKLRYVGLVLPDVENYIYKIQLPKEVEGDVFSAVKFSLEENVPIPAEEAVFDYTVLHDEKLYEAGKINVVVSVLPKNIVSTYTEIVKAAGLSPISFLPESIALSRAIVCEGDTDPYLLIRFVDNRINVAIAERGVVQYSSVIPIKIGEAISDQAGEKAIEIKTALNKVLIFWFTNRNFGEEQKKIKTALLAGEGSLSQEIDEFLERHLRIAVEAGNPWINCFDLNKHIPKIERKEAMNYCSAIGLAINLIKHD